MEKHPQLKDKFQLLYLLKINPKLNNNVELGNLLGKTKQSISRWCTGTATSRGNCIPGADVERVAEAFRIEHEWFSLPFQQFEEKVRARIAERKNPRSVSVPDISIAGMPITGIDLIGREDELNFLDSCWMNPSVNVVEVIAFGGTGKSSLINKWLSDFSQCLYKDADKIYAWSFYWQGQSSETNSSGDYFIEHALAWFGDENPSKGTPWSKAGRLANLIRDSKTLLILDGLEPLQYPPGKKHGQVENPAVSFLIRELASSNPGLLLITSRSLVADVAAFNDGRVATLNLGNLSARAGVQLLKQSGIKGSKQQFADVVQNYSGHPLSLSLIAGYLATVHRGELSRLTFDHGVLHDTHHESQVSRIMSEYMEWLDGRPGLQILQLVSLIDRTTDVEEIKDTARLRSEKGISDNIASISDSEFMYAIQELVLAKLINCKEVHGKETVECHPLVKDYILKELQECRREEWRKGNELVFDHLLSQTRDDAKSMEELEPLFRAVVHGTRAGKFEESFDLYFSKIKKGQFSMFAEGSHHADQACIRSFFKQEWTVPTSELNKESQMYLITSAATNLIYLGEIEEAISPFEISIGWFVENEDWLQASVAAAPLLSMYIASGKLDLATGLMNEMEQVIENSENKIAIAMAANFRAYILYLAGDFEKAGSLFQRADSVLMQPLPESPVIFPTISSYYCKYLLDIGRVNEALERSLKTFAWRERKSWQVAIDTTSLYASDLLVQGLIFLELGDVANAKIQLDKQVDLFRSADEWLYLPTGLNSRAKLHLALQDLESATRDLQESLQISEKTGAKFGEWEACLDLAQLHIQKKDFPTASDYLSRARSIPEMTHYKFRNQEIEALQSKLEAH